MKVLAAMLVSVGTLLGAPAYADNVLVGTGLGAALGAVVGHQVDHENGAWVGGAVGAVTGAVIATSNNNVRYVERDPYAHNYNTYHAPRRDVYVVQPAYYERRPVKVVYVDANRGHRNHYRHNDRHYHDSHRYDRHNQGGHGYHNQGHRDGRTVVVVR
ncbi:MAG: glycine zipper 2TM domain-containing protein [Halothiobacillaceae bacterium]|nr:glycine zipper 2TM domain-containing protein [Halothiobacillaceae bacterium]